MTLNIKNHVIFEERECVHYAVYHQDLKVSDLNGIFTATDLEAIAAFMRSQQAPKESEKFAVAWDKALVNTYCERVKCPVPEEVEFESFIGNLQKELSNNHEIAPGEVDYTETRPTQSQIDLAKYLVKEMPMAKDSELGKAVLDVLLRAMNHKP